MAMRALHQLRRLINELIKQDIIDANTKINIEMSRDLKNANERKAIKKWQDERKAMRKQYKKEIEEHFKSEGIVRLASEEDILKYQLWEEQGHICLYTGDTIRVTDFLLDNPRYDIEHTIPRSVSLDNSQVNKTLCSADFNRNVKRNKIPTELANHEDILLRLENWKENIENLKKQVEIQVKKSRGATIKKQKDDAIQKRHRLAEELRYWQQKYARFTMKDVPSGFKNSQMVDVGIITKYSRMYLRTLFSKVYTVKGNTVADFRKIWGLQEEYDKKARVNHIHHCVDAITIACMSKRNYEALAKFYHDSEEMFLHGIDSKPQVEKPWETFTQDIKQIDKEILVSHYTPDNLPKQSKKKLRKRGKIQYNTKGEPIYQQGDTVRGSLHKETYYGAIQKTGDKKRYVLRKPIDSLSAADVKNIVDDAVRQKVQSAIEEKGLAKALSEPIWMNEEKGIQIKKVRCYTPSVSKPIPLKKHRDKSIKEYKQNYNVTNDGNYFMALYEVKDSKGKVKRAYRIISNYDASKYCKLSVKTDLSAQDIPVFSELIPSELKEEKLTFPLKCILKSGTLVLFWDNSPEELWDLDMPQLYKRLFKLTQFEADGRVQARFHQVAKPDMDLKRDSSLSFVDVQEKVRISKGNLNILVEGYDFKLNILGQIEKL
jgi:CRISPR-associated endonuclease Csn1